MRKFLALSGLFCGSLFAADVQIIHVPAFLPLPWRPGFQGFLEVQVHTDVSKQVQVTFHTKDGDSTLTCDVNSNGYALAIWPEQAFQSVDVVEIP